MDTGRIIAFTGAKGGVGKSTLSTHAAAWCVEQGLSTVFVDADQNKSGSRFLRDAAPDLTVETADNEDDLIDLLPELAERFERVIVDAAAGADSATRSILLRADLAILPTGAGSFDLRALARTAVIVNQCRSIRSGKPEVVIVLNRLRRGTLIAKDAEEIVGDLNLPVAENTLAERVGFADCAGQGVFAWNLPGAKEAASEMRKLLGEILHDAKSSPRPDVTAPRRPDVNTSEMGGTA